VTGQSSRLAVVFRDALRDLPQGWFHHAEKMLDLVEGLRPSVLVELGTWRGASAIAFARTLTPWNGIVYGVDTFTGGVNGGRTPSPPKMLTETAGNLIKARVSSRVRLIVSPTRDAGLAWSGPPIDALYVDADHTREGVRSDLETWWPHLREGGLIAGDDYETPMYPGVREAWDEFETVHGQTFERFATPNTNPPGMRLIYGWKRTERS